MAIDINIVEDNDMQINFTIKDQDGVAVNLSGATVTMYYKNERTGTKYSKSCAIDDAINGTCHANLTPTDVAEGGQTYKAEIKVVTVDTKVYTAYDTFTFYTREKVQ